MPNSKSLIFARYQIIPPPPKVGQRVQFFSDVIQDLKVSLELEILYRVAKVGSISARATMTIKTLVKRVITIFATNAFFLQVIANLHISLSIICNTYYIYINICTFLPKRHCFLPKKHFFSP